MTWLDLPPGTGFGLANLPFGVFSRTGDARVGVAIGDRVLDVAAVADDLRTPLRDLFAGPALNRFLAAGPASWREARERLTDWLTCLRTGPWSNRILSRSARCGCTCRSR